MSEPFELERKKYKLTIDELNLATKLLGHAPKGVEWALFSALWSEHCSYKSSKIHLKKFFSENNRVVGEKGENAGIVDLGLGEKIAFKIESHNHPSFIEPYQGAATGVGGILRDIFTMGARPIALANYLCFGEPTAPRMPYLVDGVVRGIGDYGNCVGVPMITGQTEFHSTYNQNILVNAMAVGYFGPNDPIVYAKAKGTGNFVVYVGAKTGGDGVHGASMASESFSNKDLASKRPTVQVGDPFFEKLLIEACLEVIKTGLVVAIQDMGAAGLTSSSFEMSSRGGVGFELHLDKVPLRDSRMNPEEILLSESQERMLLICEPKNFERIKEMFHKWGLDAAVIGTVRQEKAVKLLWKGEVLTEIDPAILVENAPQYDRPYEVFKTEGMLTNLHEQKITPVEALERIEWTSREWIYSQFDQRVGTQTVRDCSSPVGVLKLPSGRFLGVVLGGRPKMMRTDSYLGGIDSIAEPALQLAILGFEPMAVTDCLNYGSPENKKIMGEFVSSLKGMNEMCRELSTPIISGNVSFYNQTEGKDITSTPATGLVGLSTRAKIPQSTFHETEKDIYLITKELCLVDLKEESKKPGALGRLDPKPIAQFCRALLTLEAAECISLVGHGGLVRALAKMSLGGTGAKIRVETRHLGNHTLYQVIAVGSDALKHNLLSLKDVKIEKIGTTVSGNLQINEDPAISVEELKKHYNQGWRANFENLA
jgi:phosphoribosylformylglycinamidine synthase subunit PurL